MGGDQDGSANQSPHRTARLIVLLVMEPGPGPGPSTVGRQADKVYFHRREERGARGAFSLLPRLSPYTGQPYLLLIVRIFWNAGHKFLQNLKQG